MSDIAVRAGENAYELIMNGTLHPDRITTYLGPAVGPRWLVASGFDLTLLSSGVLGNRRPVQLIGSSAGALRFAAWIQPEPEKRYYQLLNSYISMVLTQKDTPQNILGTLQWVIDSYVEDSAVPFALANKKYRLSIIAARAKYLAASEMKLIQAFGLATAFALNACKPSWLSAMFQRVVFHSGTMPPPMCLNGDFVGIALPLNEANFKSALLASSAVPLAVAGVKNIFGAPRGVYRDGGLVDYHLNQHYGGTGKGEIALMFHHEARLIPSWLDRRLVYRGPSTTMTKNLLMIHPTEEFVKRLPGGRIPTREDFHEYAAHPPERMKRWWEVVRASEHLGEEFLELLQGDKLRDAVIKL